jgi:ribonuclease HII
VFYYEGKAKARGYDLIIGVDEVGVGPLAGPVVAAAVTLRPKRFKNRIDDSKKLTPSQRENAYPEIIENCVFGLGSADEKVIDRINILQATKVAMEQAVRELIAKLDPAVKHNIYILVDGRINPNFEFPSESIIKGDGKSKSIAAASILAKVTRDRVMRLYDEKYPRYGFLEHKGYPTLVHRKAISEFGLTPIHRRSFCGG